MTKGFRWKLLNTPKRIAVISHQIKAGFVVAANFGKGGASRRTERGWSAPAFFTIAGLATPRLIRIASIDNARRRSMGKRCGGMNHSLSAKFLKLARERTRDWRRGSGGTACRCGKSIGRWRPKFRVTHEPGVSSLVRRSYGAVVHLDQDKKPTKIVHWQSLLPR